MVKKKSVSDVGERLAVLETKMDLMESQLNDIHHAIMGNGKQGLKDEIAEYRGGLRLIKWVAGSGGFISLVSLAIAIAK